MGVNQLWKLLEESGLVDRLQGTDPSDHAALVAEVEGKVIAVDLAMWIMQARESGALSEHFSPEEAAAKVAFERSLQWLRHGCTPVFVVEGAPPEEKRGAQQARFAQRNGYAGGGGRGRGGVSGAQFTRVCRQAATVAEVLVRAANGAGPAPQRPVLVAPRLPERHAAALARLLTAPATTTTPPHGCSPHFSQCVQGLPVFEAPGEAEATCAALASAGAVHAVASFDSDTLLYGAEEVYHTLRLAAGAPRDCEARRCRLGEVRRALGLARGGAAALSLVAAVAGCDYEGEGARGVGAQGGLALVQHLLQGDAVRAAETLHATARRCCCCVPRAA
jgi:flap endonuclease GEN